MSGKKKVQYAATCAFCGKRPPEVVLTDEHVLKKSLRYLATPGSWLARDISYIDPETGELRFEIWEDRNKNGYQATVRICVDCNSKVLNDLIEEPFEPDFLEMREGRAIALDSNAVTRMATWAAKTAMTNELLDKGKGDPAIPAWQYRWLRDHVCPPPTMAMYFGKAENTPNGYRHHHRFRLADAEIPSTEAHYTSFVIGHVWRVVAGFANKVAFDAFRDSVDEFFGNRHLPLARFWPPDAVNGGVSAVAPQTFPPGPEAPLELVKAVQFGPKKLWRIVDGVKREIRKPPPTLPPEGPLQVKVGQQMKTVHVVKGRPPGSGPSHPQDLTLFVNE